ncbi:MAG: PIG-L deacetylase family protein [Pseudomonadota bacterium]
MSRTVLIVVAHPDDEVLGCGATMYRHATQGDEVHVVTMTDGVGARGADEEAVTRRQDAARRAAKLLGVSSIAFHGFPDNQLDSVPLLEIVNTIETAVAELQPEIVYTHHHGDLNVDHGIVARALLTACRPLPGSSVARILACETASSTEWAFPAASMFRPQYFVDVTDSIDAKVAALRCYQDELRVFPHPRSEEHLLSRAKVRGAESGFGAAEAFEVLRERVSVESDL